MLRWADKEYDHPEIMITENGVSDKGGLVDDARIKYFQVSYIPQTTDLLSVADRDFSVSYSAKILKEKSRTE